MARPAPPTNLRTVERSSSALTVAWDSVAEVESYDVERNGLLVAETIVGTQYIDTEFVPGQEFTYRVRSSESVPSGEIHGDDLTTNDVGYTALGYTENDLTPAASDLITAGGVYEALEFGSVRIDRNIPSDQTVVLRGCKLHATGYFGISMEPSSGSTGPAKVRLEYCTMTSTTGNTNFEASRVINTPIEFHRVDLHEWNMSIKTYSPTTCTECFVHDMFYPSGGHMSCIEVRSAAPFLARGCRLIGGSTSAFSCYTNDAGEAFTDVDVRDCHFDIDPAHPGTEWATSWGMGDGTTEEQNSQGYKVHNNTWGQTVHPTCGNSGPRLGWVNDRPGNEWGADNRFADGTQVGTEWP